MKNYELARDDYKSGMKYKDIAAKYDVSISTVKSWKARYWKNEVATKKKVASKKEKVATKVADKLNENTKLNERQKMFCLFYLQSFNATQSYIKAYKADYTTAMVNGSQLLRNPKVQEQITEIKKELTLDLALDTQDVINEYAKQAFSDIGDFVKFGSYDKESDKVWSNEKEDYVDNLDVNGNKVIHHISYVQFNDQDKVDTSLIKSIKMGKDGPVIELYDKQKAQDILLKYLSENGDGIGGKVEIVDDIPDEESD